MPRIHRYKAGTHGRNLIQKHVDHHLIVSSGGADDVKERDTVKRTERMIAHCYECALGKPVEHLLSIHPELNLEFVVDERLRERDTGV